MYEAAVDLQLGDRADADADADRRHPPADCPSAPTPDTAESCAIVDAALDQHAAGADRLGIFGDERTLLGARPARERASSAIDGERIRSERSMMRPPNDSSEALSAVEQQRDRPVVDERHLHHRLELAGRDGQPAPLAARGRHPRTAALAISGARRAHRTTAAGPSGSRRRA